MAYYIQSLPQFPCPPREGANISMDPWVHDDVVLRLTAASQHAWREQLYHGEDFAGRNDCESAQDPVATVSVARPVLIAEPSTDIPAAENEPVPPSFARRMLAMVCATVIVITASSLGLWAAHHTTPKSWPAANHSKAHSLLSHR